MTAVVSRLESALSRLRLEFPDDPERLHLAVALVFSSIYKSNGVDVIVVGGQAATHWLRIDGSIDVDFVAPDFDTVRDSLLAVGFVLTGRSLFRLVCPDAEPNRSVLIELVGETVEIAGIRAGLDSIITVRALDIENPIVRELMAGDALVINPALAFLNYAESSLSDSLWHDFEDGGAQAQERAEGILVLYEEHVAAQISRLADDGLLPERLQRLLADKYGLRSHRGTPHA